MEKAKKAGGEPAGKTGAYYIVGIAALLVVAAYALYYMGFFGGNTAPPKPQAGSPLDSEAARTLLAAYDSGARLAVYNISYTTDENGVAMKYSAANDGKSAWVGVYDQYGSALSWYSGTNGSDVVCLRYASTRRCAAVGNDTDAKEIAARLKVYLPDRQVYLEQREQIRMLIEAGAIKLSPVVTDELVGGFDTKKVSYSIDYRNLTVQQLTSIGLTPNDPSIYSTTQVAHWIDKNMMLDVKTHADIYQNGAKVGVYDNEYDVLELGGAAIPPKPSDVVETGSFVQAYNQWIGDLLAKESCAVKQQTEADECFKALAIRKRNWDDCKLIKGNGAFEACTLIIAQSTNNAVLCEKLTALADDCYIAIAGETGNYELCRKLYNTSLLANCTDAAADGKRKKDEEQQVLAKQVGLLGCGTDSDCKAQGAHKQFCMPKNSTGVPSGAEDNPLYACLSGVVCSCQQGSCGFNKTAAYYSCISDVEEALTRDFIAGLIPNNATNSASGK